MTYHFLVIGATGLSGLDFCSRALQEGHTVTALVRNPSKLPDSILTHGNFTCFHGTFDDESSVKSAVACGASVFVSFAGPVYGSKGTPVTDALRTLFPLLIQYKYSRVFVLGTPSYIDDLDTSTFKWNASRNLIKWIAYDAYREFSGLGFLVVSQQPSQLKCTLFRVGWLTNGSVYPVTATYLGSGQDGLTLSRASISSWLLEQMDSEEWVGKAPVLSNPGGWL